MVTASSRSTPQRRHHDEAAELLRCNCVLHTVQFGSLCVAFTKQVLTQYQRGESGGRECVCEVECLWCLLCTKASLSVLGGCERGKKCTAGYRQQIAKRHERQMEPMEGGWRLWTCLHRTCATHATASLLLVGQASRPACLGSKGRLGLAGGVSCGLGSALGRVLLPDGLVAPVQVLRQQTGGQQESVQVTAGQQPALSISFKGNNAEASVAKVAATAQPPSPWRRRSTCRRCPAG